MIIQEFGSSTSTVVLSTEELTLMSNALNRVCNGDKEFSEDEVFADRMGLVRFEAQRFLRQVTDHLDHVSELPD
jgi:hypothetical protein